MKQNAAELPSSQTKISRNTSVVLEHATVRNTI